MLNSISKFAACSSRPGQLAAAAAIGVARGSSAYERNMFWNGESKSGYQLFVKGLACGKSAAKAQTDPSKISAVAA